jgi:hypothetical protein
MVLIDIYDAKFNDSSIILERVKLLGIIFFLSVFMQIVLPAEYLTYL